MQPAGTLRLLRRYPVKSMAGEDLQEARVTFSGLVGDRVYAFIDNNNHSNFPWMTARQARQMLLFRPRFLDPPALDEEIPETNRYSTEVVSPEGEKYWMGDVRLTELLENRFGHSLRLRFSERSMTDARPVSLFSLSTVAALSEETGLALDPRRFRANFYVQWEEQPPFFEDQLVGRELQIGGDVTIQVVKKDRRCVIINLDPATAESSPVVLEKVARVHDGCAGVYGAVLREGVVRADDPVYLL
ncbi:MAG: MOSC domain-containing protein [Candidatus Acidiferrales bacterium]